MTDYDILKLPFGATLAEVRRAYRLRALQLHPDRNPAPDAEERFKELQAAYFRLRAHAARYENYSGPRAAADARWEEVHPGGPERFDPEQRTQLRQQFYRSLRRDSVCHDARDAEIGCCLGCVGCLGLAVLFSLLGSLAGALSR